MNLGLEGRRLGEGVETLALGLLTAVRGPGPGKRGQWHRLVMLDAASPARALILLVGNSWNLSGGVIADF